MEKNAKRSFKNHIDIIQPASVMGDISTDTVKRSLEDSDDNYKAGKYETEKYSSPMLEAMAVLGANALASGVESEINNISIAAIHTNKLVSEGKISVSDLNDSVELKNKISKNKGLSKLDISQMVKYRREVSDMLALKAALVKMQTEQQLLEPALAEHLKEKSFFDLGNQKTNELIKVYFSQCENEVLRKVAPASLSEKKIKQLMKSAKKNGFTEDELSVLRLVSKQMKLKESRIKITNLINMKRRVRMLQAYAYRVEGEFGSGLQSVAYLAMASNATFAVGSFGVKSGIVSSSFIARHTGMTYLFGKINQKKKEEIEKAKEAVKSSEAYVKTTKAIERRKEIIKDTIDSVDSIKKYKEARKIVVEKSKAAAKKVHQTKSAAEFAGQYVRRGIDFIFAPAHFFTNGIGKFFQGIGKIKFAFFACVGILAAFFVLVVVMINALLSAFNSEAEGALSVIVTEDDSFISDITEKLQTKEVLRTENADELADGVPQNHNVLEGHTISKYGHPNADGTWSNGKKISYVDGNGSILLNGMNNIKEVIAMAYVIMAGDFDSKPKARDELILDLWDIMNPDASYVESDIYTCGDGCDSFTYHCDNAADYTTISKYKKDGVGFFGKIKSYSSYADRYDVECNGCEVEVDVNHGSKANLFFPVAPTDCANFSTTISGYVYTTTCNGCTETQTVYHDSTSGTGKAVPTVGCSNYTVTYTCDGHSVDVCFGHKDIDLYITVKTFDEMCLSGELPNASGKKYKSFIESFEGWTEDNKEWVELLVNSDWFDNYGIDPSGGYGIVAGAGMTAEEISAIIDTYGNVDATRLAICQDAMSWCGKIPYYWGGKATSKDYTENAFNAIVTADYKGRNRKGLDCSGFVQWVIWRICDVRIGASAGTITAGMTKISASELQPGDLGLMAQPGAKSNHVGIFVGYDESGKALWCHCNSGAGNVSVNSTTCFKHYYRIF